MRKLIYLTMISLDGFIARPDGDISWIMIDEELHKYVNDQQAGVGAYVYGRRMYQLMTDFWPTADEDPSAPDYIVEFARIWKKMPKIVFSKTLERVEGNARLVRGEVAEEITRLKGEPGKALSLGGADLAASIIQLGLVDEYHLFVNPIVLGSGMRPFPPLNRAINLKLLETRTFGSGVVFLRYERADGEQ